MNDRTWTIIVLVFGIIIILLIIIGIIYTIKTKQFYTNVLSPSDCDHEYNNCLYIASEKQCKCNKYECKNFNCQLDCATEKCKMDCNHRYVMPHVNECG